MSMSGYLTLAMLLTTFWLHTRTTRPKVLPDRVFADDKIVMGRIRGFIHARTRGVERDGQHAGVNVPSSKTVQFSAPNDKITESLTLSIKEPGQFRTQSKKTSKLEHQISSNRVSKIKVSKNLAKRMAETPSFSDSSTGSYWSRATVEVNINNASLHKIVANSNSSMIFPGLTNQSKSLIFNQNELDNHSSTNRDNIKSNHVTLVYKNITQQRLLLDSNGKCTCESTKCDLSYCNLKSVPQDLATVIFELLLHHNSIQTLPANAFLQYNLLEILNLAYNPVTLIENGLFHGLSRLRSLDLTDLFPKNPEDFPDRIFEPLRSLRILRMSSKFSCPPDPPPLDAALSYLHNLEDLYINNYIDSDSGEGFGPGFRNLTLLRHISFNCDACLMTSLWNTTFQNVGQIKSLDISNCDVYGQNIDTGTFAHLKNLLVLDISQNANIGMEYLPVILSHFNKSCLQTLIMNNIVNEHSLTNVDSSMVQFLPKNLTTLVARGNNILSVEVSVITALPRSLKTIDVSGNYILTAPEDIPLEDMEGLETLVVQNIDCIANDRYKNIHSPARNSKRHERTVYKQKRNFENSSRPQKVRNVPSTLKRVHVSVTNMRDILRVITAENNLQEIDLSCSYVPEFDLNSLLEVPNLKYLNIRRSSVEKLLPVMTEMRSLKTLILESNNLNNFLSSFTSAFWNLFNLSYLDLALNQMKIIPKDLFEGLDNMEYLLLNDNPLPQFDADISNMRQLKLLNLSNTELPHLDNEVRSHIDHLCNSRPGQVRVDMAGSPIQCDCLNLEFLKWVVSSAAFDKNFTGYKCKYPDTSSKYILDGYQETIRVLDRECAKNYPMFLIVLAATSVLLFAVVGGIIYRLRWKIRYLYYAAYLKFTDKHKNDNNHEFTYDVFVSYDSEDQAFVTRRLSPGILFHYHIFSELEKRGLKLLIHGRDFVAGTYITSNIVMAVTESRKTLVVLTRNLLESTWCNYELQMATMEAVHTGRQVLVFLLKEDIPSRELDVELLGHIRSNTYLPYPVPEEEGDVDIMKRFYDKLAHDLRRF